MDIDNSWKYNQLCLNFNGEHMHQIPNLTGFESSTDPESDFLSNTLPIILFSALVLSTHLLRLN